MTADRVDVRCDPAPGGWTCHVTVSGSGTPTTHEVSVRAQDLTRLAPGAEDPTDLVRRSFTFLLAREPATSIIHRFDLTEIRRYFPEYEAEIRP